MSETKEIIRDIMSKNPDRKGDTLEDLEVRDFDNFQLDIVGQSKKYHFDDPKKAVEFMGRCQFAILKHMGVDVSKYNDATAYKLENQLRALGIVIETRREVPSDEKWRKGIYILKNGEIAYFISLVNKVRSKRIIGVRPTFMVLTNCHPILALQGG